MLKEKDMVTPIGVFTVAAPLEFEDAKDYIQLDPYEQGQVEQTAAYDKDGVVELNKEGKAKDFDGYQAGDFFSFKGKYEVVRTNETYSKVKVGDQLVSFPNHKLIPA